MGDPAILERAILPPMFKPIVAEESGMSPDIELVKAAFLQSEEKYLPSQVQVQPSILGAKQLTFVSDTDTPFTGVGSDSADTL